jgi:hypothetical protein
VNFFLDIVTIQLIAMRSLFVLVLCTVTSFTYSQQTSPYTKFGKITAEELQKKQYPIDSNANAVVLSDIGTSAIVGNSKGWFSISFTRHRVVHILNKNGYDEADVEVHLYTDSDNEEKMDNLKAVTYNYENGKIVESKLEKSALFKEKIDKNHLVKKFTFPNVKEGCIIEYDYRVTSDFIWNLDPWNFQGAAPVLWSEYQLSVPEFFSYAFMSHGYHPLYINDRKDKKDNFSISDTRTAGASERYSFSAGVTDYRWVMKDVPELKLESFTSSIKNHIARIEFQLSSQNYPLAPHDYRNTWGGLVKELLSSNYFGNALDNSNNWLADDLKPVLAGASTELDKAQRIYAFARDNFTCTDHSALETDQSLKNVLKSRKGSVAEINLLLTAMLRYADLKTDPVILSTTGHGYALEMYPMITSFNYVVAQCMAGGRQYYLDASEPRLGFGKLMPECYNGHARVVNEMATPVFLSADSLKERSVTALFISNDDKGNWLGNMTKTPGYSESYSVRDKVKEKGQGEFFKEVQKQYGADVEIKSPYIDSLTKYEEPVALHYQMKWNPAKDDILYVDPMFGEAQKNNPFKSAERYYPVEMPYTIDETYLLTMEVPQGYLVDELPKQMAAKLDENGSAYFEYRISQSGNTISLRSIVRISRTLFMPDEYANLREFFNLIVNKQNEQIVFKKKK